MTPNFQTDLYEQKYHNIIVSQEKCLRMIAQANEAIP
jgi:hypothetical protein